MPSGEQASIYDVAMRYIGEGTPLVVFAGKEYGTGSSRDWAAKGTRLLGIRAVIAESFERIHRSNLVGMGVVPLTFHEGTSWKSLGLTGKETVTIEGLAVLKPRQELVANDHAPRMGRLPSCRCSAGSTHWTSLPTSRTVASCPMCSGTSRRLEERHPNVSGS